MNSVFFLILRRMRAPLVVLIAIYAVSVLGLTLIPGIDAEGKASPPLSFFHAFYFISYTATTIGFGEIPTAFSDGQRLWVTVCIYLTVIGWSYSIVTLLALLQDKGFQNTLVANRFARRVKQLQEPFHLICGCGETGGLVCHALDRLNQRFVVLEREELRVQELDLEDFKTDTPTLAADARQPANLLLAGLRHKHCRGVLALTDDEESNLAIAIAVRLLNPDIPVLARARTETVAANMASFGTDHIINPFERFAEYLALAVAAPERFRLLEILTGLPGSPMPEPHRPPRGHWLVCGYGTFGRAVVRHLVNTGTTVTIVDSRADPVPGALTVRGSGTEAATLREAGIASASGIVAAGDNDVNNLAIAVTARELNPGLFVVTRQNQAANGVLFEAFTGDFCMEPSRIVAQGCLAILTTPLLAHFLVELRACDESRCQAIASDLQAISTTIPDIWSVRLDAPSAGAAHRVLILEPPFCLGDLLRDNTNRDRKLPVLPLLVERNGDTHLLPKADFPLAAGDRLLLAGPHRMRQHLDLTLQNHNVLEYVLNGRENSGGWLWRLLFPPGAGKS